MRLVDDRHQRVDFLSIPRCRRWVVSLLLLALLGGVPLPSGAAPGQSALPDNAVAFAPGWMSEETAARLDLGFTVFVPSWVPAPFAGEPAVSADGGAYTLYWLIPGTPPTFLEITGTVGGVIPDYSWYDRNIQLEQNAWVQGYPAWHDLTPIYDLVYWQIGDVVYSVNSQGMTEIDSLSLANALEVLTPSVPAEPPPDSAPLPEQEADSPIPAGPVVDEPVVDEPIAGEIVAEPPVGTAPDETGTGAPPEAESAAPSVTLGAPESVPAGQIATIGVDNVTGVTLQADAGTFVSTGTAEFPGAGGFAVEWEAPVVAGDLIVTFVVVDPADGSTLATGQTTVLGADDPGPVSASFEAPERAISGELVYVNLSGRGSLVIDASAGSWPVQSPNTLFDPDARGDRTLVGSLPEGGAITLAWRAPDVSETTRAVLYATDRSGATTAEWTIEVAPGELPAARAASGAANRLPPVNQIGIIADPAALPDPGPDFAGPKPVWFGTTDGTEGPQPNPYAPTPTPR